MFILKPPPVSRRSGGIVDFVYNDLGTVDSRRFARAEAQLVKEPLDLGLKRGLVVLHTLNTIDECYFGLQRRAKHRNCGEQLPHDIGWQFCGLFAQPTRGAGLKPLTLPSFVLKRSSLDGQIARFDLSFSLLNGLTQCRNMVFALGG
jgi:hypothetical protein